MAPVAAQAAEIIAFADYWNDATGADPGLRHADLIRESIDGSTGE